MPRPDRSNALDHVVVVMFENRSFDNLLGRLYQPGEVRSFEGVVGKDLANPVPDWAADRSGGDVVRYGTAAGMNTPSPDPGEEYPHVNTQLFGIIDPAANRSVLAEKMVAPFNAPANARMRPSMDGFVADYISSFAAEIGQAAAVRRVRPDHDRVHARADACHLGAGPRVRNATITGSARSRRRRSRTARSFMRGVRLATSTTCPRWPPSRCTTLPRRSSSASTRRG